MTENNNENQAPIHLKVEPKRPVVVRIVRERPIKKKPDESKNKLAGEIVAGVRLGSSYAGGDFGAVDFSNREMLKGMFFKAKLSGSDFSSTDLSGSSFEKANLAYADFSGATLKNVNFKGADLTGVDFSNANLEGANLAGAIIKDATICNTNLAGVKLTKTVREELQRIREAMKEIDLTKVDLRKIDLKLVDFKNVDLRGVDFTGVDLSGINLVGVNLSGAKIDFSQIDGSRFMRSTGSNKVKVSKGNLAGLDPLTVQQIKSKEAAQKTHTANESQLQQEEQQRLEEILNDKIEEGFIGRRNTKRPPYKVREEDYVASKYDFPDIHTAIIEREEARRQEEEEQKQKENPKKDNDDTQESPRTFKKFFPRRFKVGKSAKVKVRN